MIVLPLKNDIIETEEGRYDVLEYTGLKKKPAVYIAAGTAVFFEEIKKINGIKVELDPDSNCFSSLGTVKRKWHLPQPKDTIQYIDYKDIEQTLVVEELKLHKRDQQELHICGDDICILINNITNITHIDGDVDGHRYTFNIEAFLKYYRDYLKKS